MGIGAVVLRSIINVRSGKRFQAAACATFPAILGCLAAGGAQNAAASIRAALVVDQNSGRIYSSYRANALHAPASLTKVMTVYLVFDAIKAGKLRWGQRIRVSRRAASRPPSKMYLRAGRYVTIRTLIYGAAVKSANDAATALAEAVAGSESSFARMMTMKARELGMYRTVFRTASGLPASGQYTTAKDMAVLARAIRRDHPRYYRVFSTRYFRYGGRGHANTNRLLHRFGSVDGIKTGYTRRARYNLMTSATNGRKRVVVVVLGASSSAERYRTTRRLLATAWRRHPGRHYVVARRAPNYFRKRTRRARLVAMTRTTRKKPKVREVVTRRSRSKSRPARVTQTASANVSSTITTSGVVHKKTLAERRAERRRKRIQLGTGAAHAAVVTRRKIIVRRERVLHLGSYRSLRSASRRAARAYRRLPRSYRRGAEVHVAVIRTRKGRRYKAQITHVRKSRTRRACRYLSRRGVRCRIQVRRVRLYASVRASGWRGSPRPAPKLREAVDRRRVAGKSRRVRQVASNAAVKSGYAIQVGASRKLRLARRAVRKAKRALPRSIIRGTRVSVLRPSSYKGRLYRARIVGMTKAEAKRACQILSDRKVRCLTILHKA